MKYCCKFMKEQLTYKCDKHGDGALCPDVVVAVCQAQFFKGALMLIGRNAEYACNYCPSCGAKWEHDLEESLIVRLLNVRNIAAILEDIEYDQRTL